MGMGRRQAGPVNPPSLEARVEDLQATVDKMHVVLKKMQAKSAASAKDPAVKANLEMWDLMVGQLDTQLRELKQAEASHQEMEARRAAMYKQADSKAQAEAKAAQQAMFSQKANGNNNAQTAGQGSAAPAPAASQTPARSPAPNTSTSPNN
jgi:peptidoglycan hydrolase CwlO-like protein